MSTSRGYHEPDQELGSEVRDMHRAMVSLIEELEAVDWYNQRIAVCQDQTLQAILVHNSNEEKEHAAMLLEWIRRNDNKFAEMLKDYLFKDKPIVSLEKED